MPQWLGGPELVILIVLVVILFGWKKLPDAARSLGRSMRIFKAEVEEMKDKPSAASRDTVHGETRTDTRAQEQPGGQATQEGPIRDSGPQRDNPVKDERASSEDSYRPPMA